MLSQIERIFPNNCRNMKIDIDDVISVRNNRKQLFNADYFSNRFWDIILVLYSHEVNGMPIDAQAMTAKLDLRHDIVLRYLNVLASDNIICAFDKKEDDEFDVARDNLSLTQTGFENTGTIIQQMRRVFTQEAASSN